MVTKPTKRRTVRTRNGRYEVSLDYVNRHALDKYDPKLDSVYWYEAPRKKKPCPAYGVRVWTYKVTDLENPDWIIEIDTGLNLNKGVTNRFCITAVRITGGLKLGIETIQLPVGEILQACVRAGAVVGVSHPSGKITDKADHSEIHADDVGRLSGFGYNKRLGIRHPVTQAEALRLADEHKIKKDKNETTQTQLEYLSERMGYAQDSCKAALAYARAVRDEKTKPTKRKKQ